MSKQGRPWYLRPLGHWGFFRSVPLRRLWVLLLAVFFLFTNSGFYTDLMSGGTKPYGVVAVIAIYSGLNACLWLIVLSRLPVPAVLALIASQFSTGKLSASSLITYRTTS